MTGGKRVVALSFFVFVGLAGPYVLLLSGGWNGLPACPAGPAITIEEPEGWELGFDRHNGCDWTFFNDQGDRAPKELYVGTGIEYPGSAVLYPVRLFGLAIMLVSLVGIGWVLARSRVNRHRF